MGIKANIRALEAARKRELREAQKRQRELERLAKQQVKLSAIEQARLEVETHENRLEVLLSTHKEQIDNCDWRAFAASLAPLCPKKHSYHELKTKQDLAVSANQQDCDELIVKAKQQDEQDYTEWMSAYAEEKAAWEKMKQLGHGILSGEPEALLEALDTLNPFDEIAHLGSSIQFTTHSRSLLECTLAVNGKDTIPTEVKLLTTTGKVSVKAMPKNRLHEIYEDYVCSCILRIARDVFALLPIDNLLITALAEEINPSNGQLETHPVMSVVISRMDLAGFNFDLLDPSDAIKSLVHRGEFKMSRNAQSFTTIKPLTAGDISKVTASASTLSDLLITIRSLRDSMKSAVNTNGQCATEPQEHTA
jgi:hypothetical protein